MQSHSLMVRLHFSSIHFLYKKLSLKLSILFEITRFTYTFKIKCEEINYFDIKERKI